MLITVLGGYWSFGGAGYPFGRNDINGPDYSSLLSGVEHRVGGPAVAAVGLVSLVVAGRLDSMRLDSMSTDAPARPPRRRAWTIGAGAAVALALIGIVVDGRMIVLLPPLGLLPIGWLEADWPTLFQTIVVAGAVLLFLASVAYARRTRDHGPAARERHQRIAGRWIRVGAAATFVAMVCPLPYAVIRLAWSRGWSVGAPDPFVASLLRNQPENVVIEPILASFAVGGAVLTLGLLRRWGRVFPRWIPVLRGRVVPLWFPLLLGGSAAIGIFGLGRGLLLGQLGVSVPGQLDAFQQWGQPIDDRAYWGADGLGWLLFPLWSGSLAFALTGYYFRCRPYCSVGQSAHGSMAGANRLGEPLG